MILYALYCNFSVNMNIVGEKVAVNVPAAGQQWAGADTISHSLFVATEYQSKLLTEIVQSYAVGDLCLVGTYVYIWYFSNNLFFSRGWKLFCELCASMRPSRQKYISLPEKTWSGGTRTNIVLRLMCGKRQEFWRRSYNYVFFFSFVIYCLWWLLLLLYCVGKD